MLGGGLDLGLCELDSSGLLSNKDPPIKLSAHLIFM